jgi:hypothetical protein
MNVAKCWYFVERHVYEAYRVEEQYGNWDWSFNTFNGDDLLISQRYPYSDVCSDTPPPQNMAWPGISDYCKPVQTAAAFSVLASIFGFVQLVLIVLLALGKQDMLKGLRVGVILTIASSILQSVFAFGAMVSWATVGSDWDPAADYSDGAISTKPKYGGGFVLCIFAWLPGLVFPYWLIKTAAIPLCLRSHAAVEDGSM